MSDCSAEKALIGTKKAEYAAAVTLASDACEADPFDPVDYEAKVSAMNSKAGEVAAAVAAYKACLQSSGGGGSGTP